jgi:hypothetical protein
MLYYVWLKLCEFIFLKLYFFNYNFPCSLIFGVVNISLSPKIHILSLVLLPPFIVTCHCIMAHDC